jgi:hypothetical protein
MKVNNRSIKTDHFGNSEKNPKHFYSEFRTPFDQRYPSVEERPGCSHYESGTRWGKNLMLSCYHFSECFLLTLLLFQELRIREPAFNQGFEESNEADRYRILQNWVLPYFFTTI